MVKSGSFAAGPFNKGVPEVKRAFCCLKTALLLNLLALIMIWQEAVKTSKYTEVYLRIVDKITIRLARKSTPLLTSKLMDLEKFSMSCSIQCSA